MHVAMGGFTLRRAVPLLVVSGCVLQLSHSVNLWSNANGSPGGTLFYRINEALDPCSKKTILGSINDVKDSLNLGGTSCINFTQTDGKLQTGMLSYVYFTFSSDNSCEYTTNLPEPGMPSTVKLNIGINEKCIERKKKIVYILTRILGLPNEHTRPDRDNFLRVHWENIDKNSIRSAFYNTSFPDFWESIKDFPYDFTSVTHTGPFEHAVDLRKPTLSSTYPGVHFGERQNLSTIDIHKLRKLYSCPAFNSHTVVDYRPIHCSFDLPLCGLVNDWTMTGVKWTKRKGPVSEEGPQTDHSNGDGWYMFVNGTASSDTARLVSISEVSPGPVCISLYYYIENNSTSLTISRKDSINRNVTLIKEVYGNGTTFWSEKKLRSHPTTRWRLLIETDVQHNGGVAIDDVIVQYGDCPNKC